MALPTLTPEQRDAALRKGTEVRRARSAAKAELAAGTLTLSAVLSGEDSRLLGARIRQVLCALPGVGSVTANKVLFDELGIDPDRRVKGLGPRQREALAAKFAA